MRHTLTLAAIAFAGTTATAGLSITEIYAGMTGEDGTVDWIEVTNTTGVSIDTGSFYYDDESRSINDGGLLDSYMLGSGESAIFLISDNNEASDDVTYASAIAEFVSIWNYAGFVGLTNGGGNLSQNGDEAVLMTGTAGSEVIESAAAFGTGFANSGATIDFVSGSPVDSVLGVNGAYQSNLFFNDNFSFPNDMTSLVGSVGLVPSPGAFAVFMTCSLLGARRRR